MTFKVVGIVDESGYRRVDTVTQWDRSGSEGWKDTAEMFARNADYWRSRAEKAERFYPPAWFRTVRRLIRDRVR